MKKYSQYIIISIIYSMIFTSCSNNNTNKTTSTQLPEKQNTNPVKNISVIDVKTPKAGELVTIGDNINIDIQLKNSDIVIDSLVFEYNHSKEKRNPQQLDFIWKTKGFKTGNNQLRISAYSKGNSIETYYLKLRFKSDIIPENYECVILKTYPHDVKAYTQGLIYENGIMYEGTGQYNESVLRKTDFETGKIMAELSLPAEYFGEGITSVGDKIIQLTWKSNVGFVYDKNSFKLLTTLQYSTEGWGLTNDGKRLIMSDGTSTIYFLDPEYFTQTGNIEVYDHEGPVKKLNELEFVNGLVYANVYQTEEIIVFDPETGKVLKRIDCKKIVPKGFQGEDDNVLNGIAYDSKSDKFYITGKRWPKLFEVKFVKI